MTKKILRTIAWLAVLGGTTAQAAPPGTTTFTENFENGNNMGGWTLGNPDLEAIDASGGNPGAFLHFPNLDTYAPQPRTTLEGSAFTGDYRAAGVSSAGIDLVLHYVDFSAQDRPVAVMLRSDGGTPEEFFDDCTVFVLGHKPGPMPNGQWRSYKFGIPSQSTTLPRGWKVQNCEVAATPDEAWNRVITDVDELRFHVGDPELFFIFQVWDFGMDNPTVTWGTSQSTVEHEILEATPILEGGRFLRR